MSITLTVGTNTYLSLADAIAYMAGRLGAAAWESATSAQQTAALVTAYRAINRQRYAGQPATVTQVPAFPRSGLCDAQRRPLTGTVTPQDIRDAQCEEALARLTVLSQLTEIQEANARLITGIKSEQIGDAKTEYFDPANQAGSTTTTRPQADPLNEPGLQSSVAIGLLSPYFLRTPTGVR
jgi:hypothetical protein